ncbi:hypothetical protein [Deinococcus sp. UR1]|uniref:hypothetical protein n=1 Tax=Deinococcus sp. UR1 TaxID=1704277 RepID=UPI001F53448B|nr:hypothetical protein [Deinococcus sp. UR1]
MRPIRGVSGCRLATVRPEALRERLSHLPLQRRELRVGAGVQRLPLHLLGAGAHDRHPVTGRRGPDWNLRLRLARHGGHRAECIDLPLQETPLGLQAGLFLPVQGGGAQRGRRHLPLGGLRAGGVPLQGAGLGVQRLGGQRQFRLDGAPGQARFPLELVDTLGHARQATPQLTGR